MEIAMLILTIISTIAGVGSFVIALRVRNDTKEIKNNIKFNIKENNNVSNHVNKNDGVVSNSIEGAINLHVRE